MMGSQITRDFGMGAGPSNSIHLHEHRTNNMEVASFLHSVCLLLKHTCRLHAWGISLPSSNCHTFDCLSDFKLVQENIFFQSLHDYNSYLSITTVHLDFSKSTVTFMAVPAMVLATFTVWPIIDPVVYAEAA